MVRHANHGEHGRIRDSALRTVRTGADVLRFRGLWWGVGLFGIALAIALSLVPDAPQLSGDEGGRLGHVMAYATLMAWFGRLLAVRHRHRNGRSGMKTRLTYALRTYFLDLKDRGQWTTASSK